MLHQSGDLGLHAQDRGHEQVCGVRADAQAGQYAADDAFKAKWAQLIAVRDEVKKVLEQARAEKLIGASLEASVTLYCSDAVYDLLNSIPMDELAD